MLLMNSLGCISHDTLDVRSCTTFTSGTSWDSLWHSWTTVVTPAAQMWRPGLVMKLCTMYSGWLLLSERCTYSSLRMYTSTKGRNNPACKNAACSQKTSTKVFIHLFYPVCMSECLSVCLSVFLGGRGSYTFVLGNRMHCRTEIQATYISVVCFPGWWNVSCYDV